MSDPVVSRHLRTPGGLVTAFRNTKNLFASIKVFKSIVWLLLAFAVVSVPYWLFIASDRYVSLATVIIQRTDQVNSAAATLPIAVAATGANSSDQLLLREYLLSEDMLRKLDAALDLRAHYSDWHRDPISRMWFQNAAMERFYKNWLSRVDVTYDDYGGVLRIQVEAYDAKTAHAIVEMMVREGEAHMNEIGHRLAQSQVDFLSKQVTLAHGRLLDASQAVVDFQNQRGLTAPQTTVESVNALIDKLETQKSDIQTQLGSLPSGLSSDQPTLIMLRKNLAAVEQQIAQKRAELTSPSRRALNSTVDEYQRLQLRTSLAQDLYKTALSALEQGRMDAARTLKMVSVLQTPTMPGFPLQPARFYNAFVTLLIALALIGIVKLMESIILDHVD